ncbi:hypothetical protein JCM6882_002085 [Rhodosporidiobolus microsporus]
MLARLSLPLLSLLASASAIPLTRRQDSTQETCTPHFNETLSTQIGSRFDLRFAWVPYNSSQRYDPETPEQINISSLRSLTPLVDLWNIIGTADGSHKVQLATNTSLCASGSGAGGNSTQLDYVNCESDLASWDLTCTSCDAAAALNCQFSPVYRKQADAAGATVCAHVSGGDTGVLTLAECEAFTEELSNQQFFSLGPL